MNKLIGAALCGALYFAAPSAHAYSDFDMQMDSMQSDLDDLEMQGEIRDHRREGGGYAVEPMRKKSCPAGQLFHNDSLCIFN
jgi:hypothetical protein